MWRAPHRPAGEVTQGYNDGVVRIYSVSETVGPGCRHTLALTLKRTLRYQERRLGIQRYYAARQNSVNIQRVIRVPDAGGVSGQDVAVTEDGRQYEVNLVQSAKDVYPASLDLTLAAAKRTYDIPESTQREARRES